MSDLRKAAQDVVTVWKMHGTAESLRGWMDILEAALAQQPEPAQEPVAWMVEGALYASKEVAQKMGGNAYTLQALYAAPQPQRPRLTDAEMLDIIDDAFEGASLLDVVRAVERKVRGETE